MTSYAVGVQITLIDHLTAGMHKVTAAMHAAQSASGAMHQQLKHVAQQLALVDAMGNMGHAMFHGGSEALEQMLHGAREYNNELLKMQLAGMKAVEIEKARAAAVLNANRDATTTYTGNLEHIQDLRSAMGFEHALEMLPAFTDAIKIARASMDEKSSGKFESQVVSGGKALEMSGAMFKGVDYAAEQLDQMRRVMTLTHGRVDFNAYLNFFKQAKTAGMLYDDNFKFKTAQYFMQEMGGQRFGTEMASINQTMNQGVMTVHSALEMQKLGMIDYKSKIDKTNVRAVASNHMVGGDLWRTNPFEAMMVFQKQILTKYPQIAAIKDANERYKLEAAVINKIGFNRGTTDAATKMILTQDMLRNKEFPMYDQTLKRGPAAELANNSSINQNAALKAQYENLMMQLGKEVLPMAVAGLKNLVSTLASVNKLITEHPEIARIVTDVAVGFTGVGAALTVLSPIVAALILDIPIATITAWGVGVTAAVAAMAAFFDKTRASGTTAESAAGKWDDAARKISGSGKNVATSSGSIKKSLEQTSGVFDSMKSHVDQIKFALALVIAPINMFGNVLKWLGEHLAGFLGAAAKISGLEVLGKGAAWMAEHARPNKDSNKWADQVLKDSGLGLGTTLDNWARKPASASMPSVVGDLKSLAGPKAANPAGAAAAKHATVINHVSMNNTFHGPLTPSQKDEGIKLSQLMARTLRNTMSGDGVYNSRFVTS